DAVERATRLLNPDQVEQLVTAASQTPPAVAGMADALERVSQILTPEQMERFITAVEKAIQNVPEGIDSVDRLSENISRALTLLEGNDPHVRVVKILLKAVGFLLILTSNPSPQVLAGTLMLMAAELPMTLDPLRNLRNWIFSQLGVTVDEGEEETQ
nr:2B protein [Rhimavirus A]